MKFNFKYISWIFDIRVWITAIITLIIEGAIEDWVFNNYGINYKTAGFSICKFILFFMLFGIITNIINKIFDKIKCSAKNTIE